MPNAAGTRQVITAKAGGTTRLVSRCGSRRQVRSSLTNTAAVAPAGIQCRGAARPAGLPRTAGRGHRAGPSDRSHVSHNSSSTAMSPSSGAAVISQSDRDEASTASTAQLDGSARTAAANPAGNPVATKGCRAASTSQPEELATSITAVSRALTTAPARDRDSAPNNEPVTRDSSTTRISCSTTAGTAMRAGTMPSRIPKTTRAVNAMKVTGAVTPANAAPSRPSASLRRGTGRRRNCSARSTGWPV